MGIGKTNEMIWYAETLKRRGLIDHCLIICGVNSVKLNFAKEIKKFSTEQARVLGLKVSKRGKVSYASIPARADELINPISEFFIITNIEIFRHDKVIEAISKSQNNFGLICVDEVHKCANVSSDQGHNLRKLKAPFKVAATGTLITNNPISAYGPLS
jgi:SNF2 family DNA or RNA helicase